LTGWELKQDVGFMNFLGCLGQMGDGLLSGI